MIDIKIQIGKTYQPRDVLAKPVTITGTCAEGIYKYVGEWGRYEDEFDTYAENGMVMHVETEFDLIKEIT